MLKTHSEKEQSNGICRAPLPLMTLVQMENALFYKIMVNNPTVLVERCTRSNSVF